MVESFVDVLGTFGACIISASSEPVVEVVTVAGEGAASLDAPPTELPSIVVVEGSVCI
jgi:hypothetical protein